MRSWFQNLRTGVKLMLAFAAALLIAVLVGLAGLASVERLYEEANRVNVITRGALVSIVRFKLIAEGTHRLLITKEAAGEDVAAEPQADRELTKEERALLGRQVRILRDQAQLVLGNRETILRVAREGVGTGPGEKEAKGGGADKDEGEDVEGVRRLSNIAKSVGDFEEHFLALVALVPPDEDGAPEGAPPAKPVMVGAARDAVGAVMGDAQRLEGDLNYLGTAAFDRMQVTRRWGTTVMMGGAAAGALLALLVGIITTRTVVRPLTEMTSAAHRMSEGDLTAEITHASRDEVGGLADSFRRMQGSLRDLSAEAQRVASGDLTRSVHGGGELGESFNRMVESLRALLREIQESGTQVRGNSARILGGLQRNAEASREEAAAADRVQESVEQLTESARGIAQSAADVERTAGDAARVASQGTASVGAALEGMFRTRERVNEITQKTLVLGEKCRRIGEVLKIIRDVAGEIHMLALNAAIESAASAGESGKRFTVVAAEVRRLAERTRQSAEEIRAILTEIQEAAEATVCAAQEGAREVEAGSTVATGSRAAMEEVIGRIHKTSEAAREISRATQDQRQASEAVAASMRDISRAVRRMAEGSEESSKAVRELSEIAERFGDLVGTFRTG